MGAWACKCFPIRHKSAGDRLVSENARGQSRGERRISLASFQHLPWRARCGTLEHRGLVGETGVWSAGLRRCHAGPGSGAHEGCWSCRMSPFYVALAGGLSFFIGPADCLEVMPSAKRRPCQRSLSLRVDGIPIAVYLIASLGPRWTSVCILNLVASSSQHLAQPPFKAPTLF
jgi:hypothetical protein